MRTLKQSGRTTRLCKKAIELDAIGKSVYLVCVSRPAVHDLLRSLNPNHRINVETFTTIGHSFDIRTMRVYGSHPNCEFLFDHYAIETEFKALLTKLHEFDPTSDEETSQ